MSNLDLPAYQMRLFENIQTLSIEMQRQLLLVSTFALGLLITLANQVETKNDIIFWSLGGACFLLVIPMTIIQYRKRINELANALSVTNEGEIAKPSGYLFSISQNLSMFFFVAGVFFTAWFAVSVTDFAPQQSFKT